MSTSPMPAPAFRKSALWILVADGKHAHFYEGRRIAKIIPLRIPNRHIHQDEEHAWELEPLPEAAMAAESTADYELGHDKRGSIFGNTSSVRHTVEPHMDANAEVKEHFMRAIAAKLAEAHDDNRFDKLIIAAPPRMLSALRRHIGLALAQHVLAEIPKDLTHCGNHDLLAHIGYALPRVQAA
jgi:protein required for attachment to host cells